MKGHVRKRPSGSWAYVLDLGRDGDGKRRQQWRSGFRTKREAQQELTAALHALKTGTYVEAHQITVSQFLDRWLEHAAHQVGPKSLESYESIVRLHLRPRLGHLKLEQLRPLHIEAYQNACLSGAGLKAPLAAKTVQMHARVLRLALKQAVRWQMLPRNPAEAVEAPRPERRQMQALPASELGRIIQEARSTRFHMGILLAISTGLRRGEVLGLRWSDVDLDRRRISVAQAVQRQGAENVFVQPKSERSRRTVELPPFLVDELRRHRSDQAQRRLLLGPDWKNYDLVIDAGDGAPFHPVSLTNAFARIVRRLGIQARLHDCRHSFATLLLLNGVHPKIVSEILGHSSTAVTMDVYSHVLPGMQEPAVRVTEEALRGLIHAS